MRTPRTQSRLDPSARLVTQCADPPSELTAPTSVDGRLGLRFRRADIDPSTPTVVDVLEQRPPLRIIRAFSVADAGALVHLHNISGGVLGGDRLEVAVQVDEHARAQLTTTGATRVYRQRSDRLPATQVTRFTVAQGGLLEYLPDPLIPFTDAHYRQRTEIELAADAGIFAWDVVTPGREARQERFAFDQLYLETRVSAHGRPIAWETAALIPAQQDFTSTVRLGAYGPFATLLICRTGLPAARWQALENELSELARTQTVPGEVVWGVSTLAADGLVVRGLANQSRKLVTGLPAFWRAAKWSLYRMEAIMPRKIY
jgi:urease accessory protein